MPILSKKKILCGFSIYPVLTGSKTPTDGNSTLYRWFISPNRIATYNTHSQSGDVL